MTISVHMVDGGWAAGYKGGQKAAGLETNRKVAFKKQVVGSAEDTNNIAIAGNSGFCTPMLQPCRSVLVVRGGLHGHQ